MFSGTVLARKVVIFEYRDHRLSPPPESASEVLSSDSMLLLLVLEKIKCADFYFRSLFELARPGLWSSGAMAKELSFDFDSAMDFRKNHIHLSL